MDGGWSMDREKGEEYKLNVLNAAEQIKLIE